MALKLVSIALSTNYERKTQTTVDTVMVTPALLDTWRAPPFQRPVRENEKVHALAEQLKSDGGVWPGIVTLGVLAGTTYIIDGQHRKQAFLLSGLSEGYTDVRVHHFADMASMGEEFVNLNSQLVKMRPDDILRGLEGSIAELGRIRAECPFVVYTQVKRNARATVSMGAVLRAWKNSVADVPGHAASIGITALARALPEANVDDLIRFLNLARESFGSDPEYSRLWGALNLTICMWLYRRIVLDKANHTPHNPRKRSISISGDQFEKCLTFLSSDGKYLDWLVGRTMSDRDRSPCYVHIRKLFAKRLEMIFPGKRIMLPQPSWVAD